MSEIFTEVIEKNHPELPVLSILQGTGTVLRDSSDRRISYDKTNLSGYKAMNQGDFIIHLRSFEGGLECSNHQGIASPAYKVLRTDCLIPAAYKDYFRSYNFIQGKLSVAVTGIRDGKNIDMPSFWEIQMMIPKINEQRKIADFLVLLAHRIEKQRQLVEALKSYKRGALSKFFPKKGETVPEYRFAGFTEPWEQCRFSELAETRRGLTYNPNNIRPSGVRVLRSSNINEDTFVFGDEDVFVEKEVLNIPYVQNGDILITAANGSTRLVGKHAIIRGLPEKCAVHGGFMLVASSEMADFVNALMSAPWYAKFIGLYVSGGNGAIGNLNKSDLDEQMVLVPKVEEQEAIGGFFRHLEHLITLHQRKLEKYQMVNSGVLQQLFI